MDDRALYSATLLQTVKSAVRQTLASFAECHAGEDLIGYALVTDDDLGSLGYFACTEKFLESQTESNARFEPVEWVYNNGVEALDDARAMLFADLDAATTPERFMAHVDESFQALVSALQELRAARTFPDEVFLTVISTDPSEHLEQLENRAVQVLNSDELYQRWRASVG
jgi:hypothetical protein